MIDTIKTGRTVLLHRVCWSCSDHGNRQEWFTTWNQAMRFARREKISDCAYFDTVEVPTGKRALAEWLNNNAATDNG
jgi:hypothetical protein